CLHPEPRYLPLEEVERAHLLEVCDVTSEAHAQAVIQAAQRSLDLSRGQLLRGVLLREPARERLLLVIHHFASDGVSLRVLLDELASACELQAVETEPPSVDPGRWAERLEAWSTEPQLLEQRAFWREQLQGGALQGVAAQCDRVGECQALSVRLDAERTAKLLREAGRQFRLRTNELLLTALVRAVQRWNGQTSFSVQLEGHGRESRWSDLDPSRSIGWFTCVYPLALEYQAEIGANLRAIKERVRSVPDAGLGYGVLTQLVNVHDASAAPSITFNYLGQLDDSFDARRSPFELLSIEPGDSVDPDASAASPIVIDAWVAGGELRLRWTVSPSALPLSAASELLAVFERELHDVIAQATAAAPALTPSDLTYVRLSQAQLDALPFASG
ncbi:MAG TPA: condensation domain-containing protein, partial [Polyangiales bacterium]|nr:condensation domain-containing protein [Polyangiales bacterium]